MLQRNSGPLDTYAFLIAIEIEKDGRTTVEQVVNRLQEGLIWLDGVGKVDCESLGVIDVYPEPDVEAQ